MTNSLYDFEVGDNVICKGEKYTVYGHNPQTRLLIVRENPQANDKQIQPENAEKTGRGIVE